MAITRLCIEQIRNLTELNLDFQGNVHVLIGPNGSGKTTVLETLHVLGQGRSPRTRKLDEMIQYGKQHALAYCQIQHEHMIPLGFRKTIDQTPLFKLAGEKVQSTLQLVDALPLQWFDRRSLSLFNAEPKARRSFLDRGCYYFSGEEFSQAKSKYQAALKQRNSLLRSADNLNKIDESSLIAYEQALATHGNILAQQRGEWLEAFDMQLQEVLSMLTGSWLHDQLYEKTTLSHQQGWNQQQSLAQALANNRAKDTQMNFTSKGPHTADFSLGIKPYGSIASLSQGQCKTLATLFLLIQAMLISETTETAPVLLLDDWRSELDEDNASILIELLRSTGLQLFFSQPDATGWSASQACQLIRLSN